MFHISSGDRCDHRRQKNPSKNQCCSCARYFESSFIQSKRLFIGQQSPVDSCKFHGFWLVFLMPLGSVYWQFNWIYVHTNPSIETVYLNHDTNVLVCFAFESNRTTQSLAIFVREQEEAHKKIIENILISFGVVAQKHNDNLFEKTKQNSKKKTEYYSRIKSWNK